MEILMAAVAVAALASAVFSAVDAEKGHSRRAIVTLVCALVIGAAAVCVLAQPDTRLGIVIGAVILLAVQLVPSNSPYRSRGEGPVGAERSTQPRH
ncbi:hypothetical protein [Nocardia terpenica]|uniref:Uncharacterized protein n=1 Tax=Nocardia terpenica TaxID=455432 RepID=A0A6G9YZ91_9NOCA|nr:hypothetical protein [Nocardia terpenica]QIS18490.1 hypothetical protein F6W96_09535 [Nocardia terpenica]